MNGWVVAKFTKLVNVIVIVLVLVMVLGKFVSYRQLVDVSIFVVSTVLL